MKIEKAQGDSLKHFVPFDRCDCGAGHYLAARLQRRTIAIVEIHDGKKREVRTLASIPKSMLAWHDPIGNMKIEKCARCESVRNLLAR